MEIVLNGERRSLSLATNVASMVEELGLPAPLVLVEHNAIALRRDEWKSTPLADGDRIEILQVSAGG
jgi:sulfur carrier protein